MRKDGAIQKRWVPGNNGRRATGWIVFALSLTATVAAWHFLRTQAEESLRGRFEVRVEVIQQWIEERARGYDIAMHAAAGLLAASQEVSPERWQQFVHSLEVHTAYPGLARLAFAQRPEAANPAMDARVHAANALQESAPIVVRLTAPENAPALGRDLSLVPEYLQAASFARDSGKTVVSEAAPAGSPGAGNLPALFMPVYEEPGSAGLGAARRQQLKGWLVAWFQPELLLGDAPLAMARDLDVEVFAADGTGASHRLYDSDPAKQPGDDGQSPGLFARLPFEFAGRVWTLAVRAEPEFAGPEQNGAKLVFVAGLITSLILLIVTDTLASSRMRALAAAQLMTERLRRNEAYSRAIVENAPVGIVSFAPDGALESVNGAAERMFGYRSHELLSYVFEELLVEPSGFRSKGFDGFLDFRKETGRRANGTPFPLELSIWPTHAGERRGYTAIVVDVTERLQTAEALRAERDFSAAVLNLAPALVVVVDLQGRIVAFNRACEETTGYSFDEVKGKAFAELLVAPEERSAAKRVFGELCAGLCAVPHENHWITKNGRRRLVTSSNTALLDAGGSPKYIISCGEDVTERRESERAAERYIVELEQARRTTEEQAGALARQAEELAAARDAALESARMKTQFLANMSHEIRTPMSGVLGMAHLLLNTRLDPEQHDYAATIRNSAEALLVVINDILDFSKIEAGKLQFEVLDFNVTKAVRSAVQLLSQQATGKGIELKSSIARDVPSWARGDPGRLRQVLLNLIGNAIKFTQQGGVEVTLTLKELAPEHVFLHFSVRDTGIGITPEACANLFHAFVQADGSTSRKFGGTGLGLAISQQLVHRMGGEIGCESAPGEGSLFWFTVKLGRVGTDDIPKFHGSQVLVLADDEQDRKKVECVLESWDVDWRSASSWSDALETLQQVEAGQQRFAAMVVQTRDMMRLKEFAQALQEKRGSPAVPILAWRQEGWEPHLPQLRALNIQLSTCPEAGSSDLFSLLVKTTSGRAFPPARTPDAVTPPQPAVALPAAMDRRVLVVEDNLVNQKVALRMLRNLGCEAEVAGDGIEALAAIERASYDLILMDCQMPEMDGYEATAEIRRRENGRSHVPIIALTAHAMQGARERCIEAGMDDYISKPINPQALKSTLRRWGLPPVAPVGPGPEKVEDRDPVL